MLDSSLDEQLSALGRVPPDLPALVKRVLGDQPFTLDEIDSALEGLSEGRALPQFERAPIAANGAASAAAAAAPAVEEASNAPSIPAPTASSIPPAPSVVNEAPLAAAAQLFDTRPPPPSNPPPVFETRSRPPAAMDSDPSSVFDDRSEPETTAEAIVAAFDEPESDHDDSFEEQEDQLESIAGMVRELAQAAAEADAANPKRRPELRGSRRPDLNELLDQPLDALDFERTEQPQEPAEARARSEAPTGAPPRGEAGDDFEILVDDEILEIAEDDVEYVDDESEPS